MKEQKTSFWHKDSTRSVIAQHEPLPFVPAICTNFSRFSGFPTRPISSCARDRSVTLPPDLLYEFIKAIVSSIFMFQLQNHGTYRSVFT